jgi:Glycosyl transferases group 1
MKNLYLIYFDLYSSSFFGVRKKLFWQLKAMNNCGLKTDLAYRSGNKLIIIDADENIKAQYEFTNLWYRAGIHQALMNHLRSYNYTSVYIRFPGLIDFSFYNTLRMLKEKGIITLLEIPTYPIGGEVKSYFKQLLNDKKLFTLLIKGIGGIIHKILSRELKKFTDYVVTFMPFEEIWGIKVIEIDNGVAVNEINKIKKTTINNKEAITLIGVANIDIWHGYDRVLKGISEYLKDDQGINKRKIYFKVVGEGREFSNIKKLANDLEINSCVEFLGMQDGQVLNDLFENADLAVSSLGMHRIGVSNGSTLKTKEYCARGIPFIYAYNEKKIPDDFEYAIKFSSDEDFINMEKVVSFYDNVVINGNYREDMRDFAKTNFTWDSQMGIIAKEISERK